MEKICCLCREDCSARPRVKDAKGRYCCKACVESRQAGGSPGGSARARSESRIPAPTAPAPSPADGDLLELEPEEALPSTLLAGVAAQRACPVCMRSLPLDAKICTFCGYDTEKGIQSSTLIEKSSGKGGRKWRCQHCGYDLKGLRDPVCPECGNRVELSKKARLDEGMRAQVIREEYLKPAVWCAIGLVITCAVLGMKGEPAAILGYGILLAIQLPLMWIGLWLCQKTFLGDIGSPLLNLVRLAAAVALGNAVDTIIPISFLFMTPGIIVFWGVLMDLFEIDLVDAIWTGIVMGIIKIAGVLFIYFAMPDLF